jgi:hypothetical protein
MHCKSLSSEVDFRGRFCTVIRNPEKRKVGGRERQSPQGRASADLGRDWVQKAHQVRTLGPGLPARRSLPLTEQEGRSATGEGADHGRFCRPAGQRV